MEKNKINILLLAFVTLILGLALVAQVASSGNAITSKTTETQTIDVSAARLEGDAINESTRFTPTRTAEAVGGWRSEQDECDAGTLILGTYTNASGTEYEDPTDIVRNTAGYFTLKNTASVNGSTDVVLFTTSYCPDSYLTSSWSRNAINYAIGFFALALLGISLALFYSLFREVF